MIGYAKCWRVVRTFAFVLAAAAGAWLYFAEYLPPLSRVHVYGDIEGFHYPLLNYAFKALRQGRFPEWDASIYCGLPFAGNIQAALFYPLNWLFFLASALRSGLTYHGLHAFLALHYWLAFLLAFLWFRARHLRFAAAALGALVFAASGYAMSEMQHLGEMSAYAWFPLGLMGIDRAARLGNTRPLWMLALSSALVFLAGYPSTWLAYCVVVMAYALALPRRWTLWPASAAALAFSMLLSAVQLLPALDGASLKVQENVYLGLPVLKEHLELLLPNYFDHGRYLPPRDWTEAYLYLGLPVLFALAWLLAHRGKRLAVPAAVAVASLLLIHDPGGIIVRIFDHIPFLSEVCRPWYLLAGISVGAALTAALGVDHFLAGKSKPPARWVCWMAPVLILGWCARQLLVWFQHGRFLSGWSSTIEAAAGLSVFTVALWVARGESGWRRSAILAAVFALVLVDYKVYGTSREFNRGPGDPEVMFANDERIGGAEMAGLEMVNYRRLLSDPAFRVAIPAIWNGLDLRHYGLSTPQGFDPLLPAQYRTEVERRAKFTDNRRFEFDPSDSESYRHFGVRYVLMNRDFPQFLPLSKNPNFRLLDPSESYIVVFEHQQPLPAWRWDAGDARWTRWEPERREFEVNSASGGTLALIEQFYPGWRAFIDDAPAPVERYRDAFQQVRVPAGRHRVRFEYRARGLRPGAGISLASLALLVVFARPRRTAP